MDGGLVEVLVVGHPRRVSWTISGRIPDEEGQKSVNVELSTCRGREPDSLSHIFCSSTSTRSKLVL